MKSNRFSALPLLDDVYKAIAKKTRSIKCIKKHDSYLIEQTRPKTQSAFMHFVTLIEGGYQDQQDNQWFFGGTTELADDQTKEIYWSTDWFGYNDLVYLAKDKAIVKSLLLQMQQLGGDAEGFYKYLVMQ